MSAPILKKREGDEREERGSKTVLFLILNTEHLSLETMLPPPDAQEAV